MKKILLMSIISLFLMVMFSTVGNAATADSCVIIEPDSGDTVTASTILNVSFKGSEGDEVIAVNFTFISPSTANSSVGTLATQINLSAEFDMANGSINFSIGAETLEDASDYTVTAKVNETTCTGTATNVIVDRTVPQTPITTQAIQSILKAGNVITYTVTGTDTTKCIISFQTSKVQKSTGTNTFAIVHSGDTCTYTIPAITVAEGVYSMRGIASDGKDETFSTALDIEIDNVAGNTQPIEDGIQVGIAKAIGIQISNETLAIAAIVAILAVGIFGKKKKR